MENTFYEIEILLLDNIDFILLLDALFMNIHSWKTMYL